MIEDDHSGPVIITTRTEGKGLALCVGDAGHWHVVTLSVPVALRLAADCLAWVSAETESPPKFP